MVGIDGCAATADLDALSLDGGDAVHALDAVAHNERREPVDGERFGIEGFERHVDDPRRLQGQPEFGGEPGGPRAGGDHEAGGVIGGAGRADDDFVAGGVPRDHGLVEVQRRAVSGRSVLQGTDRPVGEQHTGFVLEHRRVPLGDRECREPAVDLARAEVFVIEPPGDGARHERVRASAIRAGRCGSHRAGR